jgi:hypothetical protein
VRVTDQIDQSTTVKFVFIVWVGERVPFIQKAKVTTHKGSISALIGQYHNDVHASNLSELSEDIVLGKVRDASGSGNRVKDASQTSSSDLPRPVQTSNPRPVQTSNQRSVASNTTAPRSFATPKHSSSSPVTKTPGVPQPSSIVVFLDEDNLREAIKAVRSNSDPTDWVLITYEGNTNKLKLAGRGEGGINQLLSNLREDAIFYGFLRTTDTVDNTVAVKFVLVLWVGEKVPFARKARITTHRGELTSFVGQYHVDVNCSNLSEINENIVRDLVQRASGTAIHVK